MKSLELLEVDKWNIDMDYGIGKGKSSKLLPSSICGAYFMLGRDGYEGIIDTSQGDWNANTRVLKLDIAQPKVWSVNNNFQGIRLFYIALLARLKVFIHFDQG